MYEYRKLSPEEQKEIVEIRRSRGYPLHAPPHPFRRAGYYFISAANYEHQPIMCTNQRRTEFEIALLDSFNQINADVRGWIILPNHYHILVQIESLDDVSKQLQRLHGSTSYRWNKENGVQNKRTVWYHFADRLIRNEWHYYTSLNYIHYNPVKHNYSQKAYEWMWSSLHLYLEDYGRDWLVNKWHQYKPGDEFGKKWDVLD